MRDDPNMSDEDRKGANAVLGNLAQTSHIIIAALADEAHGR
jgi:hypothetical protein